MCDGQLFLIVVELFNCRNDLRIVTLILHGQESDAVLTDDSRESGGTSGFSIHLRKVSTFIYNSLKTYLK